MQVSKFQLGSWVLNSPTMTLEKEGVCAKLQPKTLDLLLYLIDKHGQVVLRDELIQAVWPETAATDDTLNSTIAKLRKILVSGTSTEKYIGTLPKRGYRLLANVTTVDSNSDINKPADNSAVNNGIINNNATSQSKGWQQQNWLCKHYAN